MSRWIGAVVLLGVMLSACDSKDQDTSSAAGSPVPTAIPSPKVTGAPVAPEEWYSALGDSFASGEGAPTMVKIASGKEIGQYVRGTNTATPDGRINYCHRSKEAYAYKVKAMLGPKYTLKFEACSGAVTQDYGQVSRQGFEGEGPQREGVDEQKTRLVTLQFGGNDAGFAAVVKACVTNTLVSCIDRTRQAIEAVPKVVRPRLVDLYGVVARNAPRARILVVGYPRVFPRYPTKACTTNAPAHNELNVGEQRAINDLADLLNRNIQEAIRQAQVKVPEASGRLTYVDVTGDFEGHGLCDPKRWFNQYVRSGTSAEWSFRQSFHPTTLGHQAMALRIVACYNDPTQCGPRVPPVYGGETYPVNVPIGTIGVFDVSLVSYTYIEEGIQVRLAYRNHTASAAGLLCPFDEASYRSTISLSSGSVYPLTRGICTGRAGARWTVGPFQTSYSWGVFPLQGLHGGERFRIVWYNAGPSRGVLLMK